MAEQLVEFYEALEEISPKEISFLQKRDPFQFLISVILSAQTTDERVNQVTPTLFAKYPGPKELAQADIEDVKRIIRTTGFFNAKARHIIDCAKAIVDRLRGVVPTDMDDLLTLPGVGRKTANCLRSDVFGLPGIIVDTHFSRVINRVFGLGTRDPQVVEDFVSKNLPKEKWSRFSMTANLFGRQICHASNPECERCPIRMMCCEFEDKNRAVHV